MPIVRSALVLAIAVFGGCAVAPEPRDSTPSETAARPNIVLFLVDDLGQQDVSVPMLAEPSALNARYRTPNLEALAARGQRFSSAYAAAPVCTPSRTAILTGQSPARTHITYWTLEKDTDTSSRHATLVQPAWETNGAQPSPATLPALLREAGYCTIHAGKAHFGARGTEGADPRALGFEVNIAGHAAGAPGSFYGIDHFKDAARKRRERGMPADPSTAPASVWDVPGLARWHGEGIWLDDAVAREACDALSTAVAADKPFFLSFCPYGVHAPIMQDARFSAEFAALDPTERAYATMVRAVDDALGQIVARCEALGVLDETVIVFTSDNGGLSAHARGAAPDGTTAHAHNAPLRSGKGSAYEGGLRVPLVVAGPGIPHRADTVATPVVGTDLYPTLLALAGTRAPEGRTVDGVDLRALWMRGEPVPERTVLFHQPHKWGPEGPGIEPFSAIRRGDWKLVWFHDGSVGLPAGTRDWPLRLELYDAAGDPGETRECSGRAPEVLADMRRELRAALDAAGAQFPTRRDGGALAEP
jgi:arylsulfatase A-like enzyme